MHGGFELVRSLLPPSVSSARIYSRLASVSTGYVQNALMSMHNLTLTAYVQSDTKLMYKLILSVVGVHGATWPDNARDPSERVSTHRNKSVLHDARKP